jgi:hypothetical protein
LRSRQLSRDQTLLCKVFTQHREKIDNVDIKVGELVEEEHDRVVTGNRASGSRPSLMILAHIYIEMRHISLEYFTATCKDGYESKYELTHNSDPDRVR